MALEVWTGGAWRNITNAEVYQGGVWQKLRAIEVYRGGAWRLAASYISALSVTVDTNSVFGSSRDLITTNPVTAIVGGGLGPFSYAWTLVSHSGPTPVIGSPTMAGTVFQQQSLQDFSLRSAVFRCTATDSAGQTAIVDVTASFFHEDISGNN